MLAHNVLKLLAGSNTDIFLLCVVSFVARQVYTATPHVGVTNEPEAVPETVEAGESNDPLCSTAQDTHNRNAFQLEHLSDEANTGIAGDVETSCENSNISNSEKGGSLVDGSICRHYNRPAPPKFHNQVGQLVEACVNN